MGVVRPRGCPCAPYVHMPPVCLDTPYVLTPHMSGCPLMFRCPQMFGASKHKGDIKTYRGYMNIGNIWILPKPDNPP